MGKKKQLSISEMAKMGGKARAKKLTKEQLSKIGRKGAATRWAKRPGRKSE
ncbi:MAG: hypothetical protein WBC04_17715 [Candidatus Acidiferrales bacterium]